MRMIAYTRVSTEEQANDGISLIAQRRRIEDYCNLYDMKISHYIAEEGKSARNIERTGLQEALQLLEDDRSDGIIVAKLDRLTRRTKHLSQLLEKYFNNGEFALVSVAEQLDPRTPGGKLVMNILAAVAEWEIDIISERTRDAFAFKRLNCEYTGGNAPYGYRVCDDGKLVEVAEEITIIEIANNLRKSGLSLRAIGEKLNDVSFTRNEKPWTAMQVKRLLKGR